MSSTKANAPKQTKDSSRPQKDTTESTLRGEHDASNSLADGVEYDPYMIFDRMGDGYFACDAEWRFVYMNRLAEQLLDVRREDVLGRNHWDIFPLTLGTNLEREYRLATAGEVRDFENFYEPWGRWFHNRCFPREGGGMCVYFRDVTEQKRLESTLKGSLDRLRSHIDNTPVAVIEFDREFRITRWSRKAEMLFGWSAEEVVGKRTNELRWIHEDDAARVSELLGDLTTETLTSSRFINRNHRKDGSVVTCEWYTSVLSGATPEEYSVLSLVLDVSERVEAERALQASEARLRFALEKSGTGAWDLDLKDFSAKQSPEDAQILGYPSPVPGWSFESFLSHVLPEDRADLQSNIKAAIEQQTGLDVEFRIRRVDDEVRWVRAAGGLQLNESGESLRLYGIVRDVTDEKRREEALRQSEERYRTVADNTYDFEFWLSPEGRFLYVSPSCKRIYGLDPEDFVTDPAWRARLIHPDDRAAFVLHCIEEEGQCVAGEAEYRIVRLDGSQRWIAHACQPVYDADGRYLGIRGNNRDITERKRLEAERIELRVQKSESLGRMAGAIAHLFNNKLAVVLGNLEMAQIELPEGHPVLQNLDEARLATTQAAKVSRLMLAYLGQGLGTPEVLDLAGVCAKSVAAFQCGLPQDATLTTDLPRFGPLVVANAHRIEQVLNNLLTNASEATIAASGTIRLSVTSTMPSDIRVIHCWPLGWRPADLPYACVAVMDDGHGIAEADMANLFEPFFTTKFIGRGLGLPVALGVIQAYGGAVTVESEPGRGSIFRVYLPLAPEKMTRSVAPADHLAEIGDGGTILVVDDEPFVRKLLAKTLTQTGYTVIEATNGCEAVEVFQQHEGKFRCVILDVSMPQMDGWQTLTALRELRPDVRVILASGYDLAQLMDEDRPERPDACLGKPFTRMELTEALRRALGRESRGGTTRA